LIGAAGETYNVGHPREVWIIRDLAERLARERGTTVRAPANEEASPPSIIRPDCTRLQALGWQPYVDIDEGFRRTLTAYGEPS
jgi:nucleoside-diphosphate-sugar epimerase